MVEKVVVHALYCGQGMTNWLEYHADATQPPTRFALIDCGGDKEDANTFIVDRLFGYGPDKVHRIDFALFSHQDQDHWNKLKDLEDKITNKSINISLSAALLGGFDWASKATKGVKKFFNRFKAKISIFHMFPDNFNNFEIGKMPFLHEIGKCKIKVICTNIPSLPQSGRKKSKVKDKKERCNGSSAVISVEIGGKSVILPGDATLATVIHINNMFSSVNTPPEAFGMMIPHHGSVVTMVPKTTEAVKEKGKGKQKGKTRNVPLPYANMDFEKLQALVENTKPRRVGVSAGGSKFGHPDKQMLEKFQSHLSEEKVDRHNLWCHDYYKQKYELIDTDRMIWTTATKILNPAASSPSKKRKIDGEASVLYRNGENGTPKRKADTQNIDSELYLSAPCHIIFEMTEDGDTAFRTIPVTQAIKEAHDAARMTAGTTWTARQPTPEERAVLAARTQTLQS